MSRDNLAVAAVPARTDRSNSTRDRALPVNAAYFFLLTLIDAQHQLLKTRSKSYQQSVVGRDNTESIGSDFTLGRSDFYIGAP